MAKDRRNGARHARKQVGKTQFLLRIAAVIAAVAVLITVMCIGFNRCGSAKPTDGTPTVTTTTVARGAVTTTSTTMAAATTTTAASTSTSATSTTTTTTVATTTTTKTPANYTVADLRLVNPWHAMTEAQINAQNLVYYKDGYYVDAKIIDALNAMLADGAKYGLYVTSAYRSYETQDRLYKNKVQRVINATGMSYEDALVEAATVVAKPGTSEHHTGLAVDLLHSECYELEEYWDQSEAFTWLKAHCAEYGFILRYPKEKQHITGVIYEPWHYRYVGVEAATAIMSRGITLEEYLQ